jgi:two-component system sensor histidine kinase DesK
MIKNRMKDFQPFPKRFGVLPYVFLFYLLMPAFYIWQAPLPKEVVGFILIAVFIWSYRKLYFVDSNSWSFSIWLGIQMAIILVFTFLYNPGCLFLGFYPANFIAYFKDKKKFRRWLIGLFFLLTLPVIYFEISYKVEGIWYFIPFLIVMLATPFGMRSMNARQELEKKLDQANEQIKEFVKREERIRIARDLHDTLGHTLSLITLKSQLVSKLALMDPNRAQAEAKEIEKTSRAALKQVRGLVSNMKAVMVSEELTQLKQIFQAAGIDYEITGHFESASIPLLYQNMISMCIREAATNIVKHSYATACSITIDQTIDRLAIHIKDNGVGFGNRATAGNGLLGMEERLALIDGEVLCFNDSGAVVQLNIPIIRKAKKEDSAG